MRWRWVHAAGLTAIVAVASFSMAEALEPRVSFEERREIHRLIHSLGTGDDAAFLASSRALEEKGSKAVPFLASALIVNPNPRIRYQVARVLAEIRDEGGIDALFQASALDPDDSVRRVARASLDALIDRLNSPELGDRRARMDYGKFSREAIFSLRRRLRSDPLPSVRERAAEALAQYGDERDLGVLLQVARNDNAVEVRREAARAVVEIAYPVIMSGEYKVTYFGTLTRGPDEFRERMVRTLVDLIENEPHGSVRLVLVKGLVRLSYPTFVIGEEGFGSWLWLKARSREVILRVRDCLLSRLEKDASADVRKEASASLSRLFMALFDRGDPETNEELRRSLLHDKRTYYLSYPYMPARATYFYRGSFRYFPSRSEYLLRPVQRALAKACSVDPDARGRQEAVLGLTYLGEKRHARVILDRLRVERSETVWLASMDALSSLGGDAAAEALLNVFRKLSNSERLRKTAVLAIGRIGTKTILRNLAAYVPKEPNREVKFAILEAIGFHRDAETAAVLVKACQDPDPKIRIAAIGAAGMNFTEETIALLKRILKEDPDENVRAAACTSLSKTLKDKAAGLLLEALRDEGAAVREAAAVELGLREIERSADALVSVLLNDANPFVRAEAATALGSIGGHKSVRPLITAVTHDANPIVRQDALRALLRTDEPRTAIVAIVAMLPQLARENPYAYMELDDALIQLRDRVYGGDFTTGSRVGMPGITRTRGISPQRRR